MKLEKFFGWGIAIYAIAFLVATAFETNGFTGWTPGIVDLITIVIVATIAGHSLRFSSWKDILPYSIGWAIIAAALDVICTLPLTGSGLYAHPGVWIGYALIILVPLFAPLSRRAPQSGARL